MKAIRFERIQVTPTLAKKWLGQNAENNRLEKESRIPGYARDMTTGHWNSNTGETIKFDTKGRLIDGQNRLAAVVLADMTVEFDVVFDVPESAMRVIDTGAARTAADVLKIAGARERMRAASVVRWVIMWDAGALMAKGSRLGPTASEVIERYLSEQGLFDGAVMRGNDCSRAGLGNGSAAAVAFYLFARIDLEQTHQFFDQFITGADLPERSSVLALRNRIARTRVDRLTRQEQLALYVRSWNAFREGRPMDRMLISKGELTVSNFPQPR